MSFLGSALGGLAGFALAPFTGGSSLLLTGLGAAAGSKLTGGSDKEALLSGVLGGVGANYLPGMMGAEAGLGTGASLASMGGGTGLIPGAAGEGLTLGGGVGLGTGLGELGSMGAIDYSLGGMGAGLGGLGLTAPGIEMAGLGAGMGPIDYSLAGGMPTTGVTGGSGMMDMLRRRMAGLGMTPSNLGMIGGGLNMLSGLYGLNAAQQMSQMASRADPFAGYRPGYAAQLSQLTSDPSRITSMPGYRAGLQAVQRSMAAQGFQGSGNMMAALQKYGGDFYNQEVNRLASLGGANISPQIALQGQGMASELASRGLASLGYGARMMGA